MFQADESSSSGLVLKAVQWVALLTEYTPTSQNTDINGCNHARLLTWQVFPRTSGTRPSLPTRTYSIPTFSSLVLNDLTHVSAYIKRIYYYSETATATSRDRYIDLALYT